MKKRGLVGRWIAGMGMGVVIATTAFSSVAVKAQPDTTLEPDTTQESKTTTEPETVTEGEKAKDTVDLKGVYHAALGVSTATQIWMNRNAYFNAEDNKTYGTDQFDKLVSETLDGTASEHAGTFQDVLIAGNGTYTVSLEGANFEGETLVCMMHVATDIPVNDVIKFTDVKAVINGQTFAEFDQGFMEEEENYLDGGMDLIIVNHWRSDLVKLLEEQGVSEDGNGVECLRGAGDESIEVTFTVSGFDYDKEEPEETMAAKEVDVDQSTDNNGEGSVSIVAIIMIVILISVVVAILILITLLFHRGKQD